MSFKKVAKIQYQFDDDGNGTMEPNRSKIFVSNDCSVSRLRALDIEHENLVPARFMDSEGPHLIYHPIGQSLQDFAINWGNEKSDRDYIMSYKVPGVKELFNLRYFHEGGRSLLRQMLKFVVDQHAANRSLEPFTLHNLSVVGDVVKFYNIGFRSATHVSRRQDFRCIFEIVKQLFKPVESYPKDLEDLCQRMTSNAFLGPIDGKWLANHLSIMSHREALAFMVNCSEKMHLLERSDRQNFGNALAQLTGCNDWHKFFNQPIFYYLKKCLQMGMYSSTRNSNNDARDVKLSMIRSCRNMVVHVAEVAWDDKQQLDEVGINLMMMEAIGAKLLKLQELMALHGVLDKFL